MIIKVDTKKLESLRSLVDEATAEAFFNPDKALSHPFGQPILDETANDNELDAHGGLTRTGVRQILALGLKYTLEERFQDGLWRVWPRSIERHSAAASYAVAHSPEKAAYFESDEIAPIFESDSRENAEMAALCWLLDHKLDLGCEILATSRTENLGSFSDLNLQWKSWVNGTTHRIVIDQ